MIQDGANRDVSPVKQGLPRTMNTGQLVLVAVGNIVGAGFFLGSGIPLFQAGKAAFLAYLVGGFFMYLTLSMLAEMATREPIEGGFSAYAAKYFGPWLGFISGWLYWFSGVMTMASEVVAAAVFTMLWFPGWPLWIFAIFYSVVMILVNTRDTAGFARVEGALSLLKLVALVLFVIIAGYGLRKFGLVSPGAERSFLPHGWGGFWRSMPFVMFGYSGIMVVTMAAAETRDPERTIPRAIRIVLGVILGLYLSSILLISLLLPGGGAETKMSPFVLTLTRLQMPFPAALMNGVILCAALSSMNTVLYGVTRMLRSLGERGAAPAGVARLNRRGVPVAALWVTSIALALTISLSYFLPKTAYTYLSGSTSLITMFNWAVIALVHLRFRAAHQDGTPCLFCLWGYPWTSYLGFMLAALIFASAWLVPGLHIGMTGLFILLILGSLVYHTQIRPRQS